MPRAVAQGAPGRVWACGFCHLPDGAGRPENAVLAGLSVDYIVQQTADIKSGLRRSAWPGPYRPTDAMRAVADSATHAEVEEAARYFARQKPRRRFRVVERSMIPRPVPAMGLYFPAHGGGVEPLGQRLIEMPTDPERHERRDAALTFVAYVPPGSVARGRALATAVRKDGVQSCTFCHGPQLRGIGPVPPIAGRSPSYLLRQLLAFRTGARAAPSGAPMRDVAAGMSLRDMIALSAYAGSREP